MKFRKKPVVVEAVRFNRPKDILDFWPDAKSFQVKDGRAVSLFIIPTLEGRMNLCRGEWLIRGVKGEFYPCKPDIFEATYEKVEGASNDEK